MARLIDYNKKFVIVYVCTGNDKEKLNWFRTINIAGVQLSPQELRNAIYRLMAYRRKKSISARQAVRQLR